MQASNADHESRQDDDYDLTHRLAARDDEPREQAHDPACHDRADEHQPPFVREKLVRNVAELGNVNHS
jgi:hypothetical protein